MNNNDPQITLRLDHSLCDRIDRLAARNGLTRSAMIRHALRSFATEAESSGASQRRMARTVEYAQLALDVIIRDQYPDVRDKLLAETDKRVEQYHAAR